MVPGTDLQRTWLQTRHTRFPAVQKWGYGLRVGNTLLPLVIDVIKNECEQLFYILKSIQKKLY